MFKRNLIIDNVVEKDLTIFNYITDFLNEQKHRGRQGRQGNRDSTIKWLSDILLPFARWFSDKYGDDVTLVTINHLNEYLDALNNSPASINGKVTVFKLFFSWLNDTEVMTYNPAKLLAKRDYIPGIKFLNDQEIDILLGKPSLSTFGGRRDYVLLLTLLDTGGRITETLSVTLQDLQYDLGPANQPTGLVFTKVKGKKPRVVALPPRTGLAVQSWINTMQQPVPKEQVIFLFPNQQGKQLARRSFEKRFKDYVEAAGIRDDATPHTLRHTFAKNYLMAGGDLESLSQILGHSEIKTTQLYGRLFNPQIQEKHRKHAPTVVMKLQNAMRLA